MLLNNHKILFFLLSSIFLFSCSGSSDNTDAKKIQATISVKDLTTKIRDNNALTIIDVRSEKEYYSEIGHIKGSKLIPLPTIKNHIQNLKNIDDTIYVVCLSGKRSSHAAKLMRDNEIAAISVQGGMLAWNRVNDSAK